MLNEPIAFKKPNFPFVSLSTNELAFKSVSRLSLSLCAPDLHHYTAIFRARFPFLLSHNGMILEPAFANDTSLPPSVTENLFQTINSDLSFRVGHKLSNQDTGYYNVVFQETEDDTVRCSNMLGR